MKSVAKSVTPSTKQLGLDFEGHAAVVKKSEKPEG